MCFIPLRENKTIQDLGDDMSNSCEKIFEHIRKQYPLKKLDKYEQDKVHGYTGKLLGYLYVLKWLALIEDNFDWIDTYHRVFVKLIQLLKENGRGIKK